MLADRGTKNLEDADGSSGEGFLEGAQGVLCLEEEQGFLYAGRWDMYVHNLQKEPSLNGGSRRMGLLYPTSVLPMRAHLVHKAPALTHQSL